MVMVFLIAVIKKTYSSKLFIMQMVLVHVLNQSKRKISNRQVLSQQPPSVQFKKRKFIGHTTAKSLLDNVAQQMMANPNCKVKLVAMAHLIRVRQLSWDHVNAIKTSPYRETRYFRNTSYFYLGGMEGSGSQCSSSHLPKVQY